MRTAEHLQISNQKSPIGNHHSAPPRLNEVVSLRIKDVDRGRGQLTVRAGKGDQDRMTVLPTKVVKDVLA